MIDYLRDMHAEDPWLPLVVVLGTVWIIFGTIALIANYTRKDK